MSRNFYKPGRPRRPTPNRPVAVRETFEVRIEKMVQGGEGMARLADGRVWALASEALELSVIASGGVSSLEDVRALKAMGVSGAIIGKAYYTGAVSLKEAIEVAL